MQPNVVRYLTVPVNILDSGQIDLSPFLWEQVTNTSFFPSIVSTVALRSFQVDLPGFPSRVLKMLEKVGGKGGGGGGGGGLGGNAEWMYREE